MEVSEKVAYLKGLAEGLALDTESKEGKLISAIIDVLDEMSEKMLDMESDICDIGDGLDAVSDDLEDVEDVIYDDDDYDEDEDDDDYDGEWYDTTCPACEEEILFNEDELEAGEILCPNCGEKLEFDLSDLVDETEEEDDD